ncbi:MULTISPECIES: hypothetical protein [unclassified Caballeronia]|uniref:hypothetical protein n=1 Tax=unclassified Caballeronia TaxID=2646786 RepID=UPI00285486BE|nr:MULTISPECIES: hypothetical protein [unclassified Caballeronia]MDR5776444.1 hypothetical protein [Caballeronia sp. LZ002]MDR5806632.1 hypothetical protein [Caballeronia sp. LZ001]MDR5851775.1 hypothetical protein [Caballeronia sp. LZ003]
MSFNTEWVTLGKHRTRLSATHGFPTETLRTLAEISKIGIEHTMSARARLVEVLLRDEDGVYIVSVATTVPQDKACVAPLELALTTLMGLPLDRITVTVAVLSEAEVELKYGVYERLIAQKLGAVAPIQ